MTDFDDLLLGSDEPFATGASEYLDYLPGSPEPHPRVYVQFRPEGVSPELSFLALVDTGAHYCILNKGVADLIRDRLTESVGEMTLRTAHGPVRGSLYTYRIQLIAETGDDLSFECTLFISPDWRASNFLGYVGALERLRFAVDAPKNRFYFGFPV